MRYAGDDPEIRYGFSAFDGVALAWTVAEAAPGSSPPELKARLRARPTAWGERRRSRCATATWCTPTASSSATSAIDPDEQPTPVEAIALRRMQEGALRSRGSVDDAITVATLETGVPLCALDADRLLGDLGVEATAPPVIADGEGPVAVLFEPAGPRAAPSAATRRLALAAVGVPGVSRLSVEEALWTAWDTLA